MVDLQTSAWWKQVEGKDTDDLRNGFRYGFVTMPGNMTDISKQNQLT